MPTAILSHPSSFFKDRSIMNKIYDTNHSKKAEFAIYHEFKKKYLIKYNEKQEPNFMLIVYKSKFFQDQN